jgi:hypothetical protein
MSGKNREPSLVGARRERPHYRLTGGKTFRVQAGASCALVLMGCVITANGGIAMLSALIGVLIIVVIGAICFWAIDKFAADRRLAQLLKLLVVLICIAAILQRILPLLGVYI